MVALVILARILVHGRHVTLQAATHVTTLMQTVLIIVVLVAMHLAQNVVLFQQQHQLRILRAVQIMEPVQA